MIYPITQLFKNGLKKIGIIISRQDLSMEGCFERSIHRGIDINSVIDVGAAVGGWSQMVLKYLPNAQYLLIEAQEAHLASLEKLQSNHAKIDIVLAAAGNREGKIYFNNQDLFGGLASEMPFEKHSIEVPVTTIDIEVKKKNLKPPFCIKLDTHGFEVPILEGAKETLKKTNLVIIEAYNYQLTKDSLRFFELCGYMKNLGFSPIELADVSLRPYDNSLWQMDIFFIPSDNKAFHYNSHK